MAKSVQPMFIAPMIDVEVARVIQSDLDRNYLTVELESSGGVGIRIPGHSTSSGENDSIIYIERQNREYVIRIWADVLQEEPTHKIVLSGARNERYDEKKFSALSSQTHEYEKKDA